jgi:hypothetical protein
MDDSEDTKLQENLYNSSPEATTSDFRDFLFPTEVTSPSSPPESLSGKLSSYFPAFFSTLTCFEKETLDASGWLKQNTSFEERPMVLASVSSGPDVGGSFRKMEKDPMFVPPSDDVIQEM